MKKYRFLVLFFLFVLLAGSLAACAALTQQTEKEVVVVVTATPLPTATATTIPVKVKVEVNVVVTGDGAVSVPAGAEPNTWSNQDGHAIVGNTSTPRFYSWLEEHIRETYPTAKLVDNTSWKQAVLPDGTIISWAEWGKSPLSLGQIDGVQNGKALFVAMRDYADWVKNGEVTHYECSGTFIPAYSSNMAEWSVANSTILQFDGDASQVQDFVSRITESWSKIRRDLGGCPE